MIAATERKPVAASGALGLPLRGAGLQRQGMQLAAHFAP